MIVADILSNTSGRLAIVDVASSVKSAAHLMSEPQTDLVLVCDNGVLVGIITKSDIVAQVGKETENDFEAPVNSIMKHDITFCRSTDTLPVVWQIMKDKRLQRIPVVNEQREPLGVVYAPDALQKILDEVEVDDDMLREYISGSGYR